MPQELQSIKKNDDLEGTLEYIKFLETGNNNFLGGSWNPEFLAYVACTSLVPRNVSVLPPCYLCVPTTALERR